MSELKTTSSVLWKFGLLVLAGFLFLTVGLPLLSLAISLLPFAAIGFGLFAAIHVMRHGWSASWSKVQGTLGPWVAPIGRCLGGIGTRTVAVVRALGGPAAYGIIGSAIGGLLGAAGSMEFHDAHVRVPAGIAIGAAVGVLATFAQKREKTATA